jgi:hypothetical protein
MYYILKFQPLYFRGKTSTTEKSDEPFTPTVYMQDVKCGNDGCGYLEKAASLMK